MRLRAVILLLTVAGSGCVLSLDYSGTSFRCDQDQRCPDDQMCVAGQCVVSASADGGATSDAQPTPDAAPLVCGDGLCTEDCDSCAADCGACLAGQLLHWPFDDAGSMANDASGNGNHGTVSGASWVSSNRGPVIEFDGIDDFVALTAAPATFQATQVALSVWVKAEAAMGHNEIVGFGDQYALRVRNPEGVGQFFQYNGMDWNATFGTTSIDDGQWHHIVGQFDGAEQQLWVNGVLELAAPLPTPINYGLGGDVVAGRHTNGGAFYLTGQLDDVRIFDRVLTPAEIADLASR